MRSPLRPAIAALVLAPAAAGAIQLPALFEVTGVPPGSVLVVHAEPDPASEELGFLPADGRGIEVVATDPEGRWARINMHEHSGWVAQENLQLSNPVWSDTTAPQVLACFGTTPRWWFQILDDGASLALPDNLEHGFDIVARISPEDSGSAARMILAENDGSRATLSLTAADCSESAAGVHRYGLAANLLLETGDTFQLLAGCCSLTR
ncbi:MAG: hypothetical protein KDK03_09375 [Rhodobacteraceae bacterium]|nr:hypothetical protein [Paracoccaceae bacterium]